MKIHEAEATIAEILRHLEVDGDVIVDTVEILRVDVTKVSDDRPRFVRRVQIKCHRLPGQEWTP